MSGRTVHSGPKKRKRPRSDVQDHYGLTDSDSNETIITGIVNASPKDNWGSLLTNLRQLPKFRDDDKVVSVPTSTLTDDSVEQISAWASSATAVVKKGEGLT